MITNLRLLLRLWYQPGAAMSEILDRGSLLFASLAALCVSILLQAGAPALMFISYHRT